MKQKSIKGRNLNRSVHYSHERLKKSTKRQYLLAAGALEGAFEN